MKKVRTKASIKIKAYTIISQAVENGILYGWNRAHKHTDTPGEEHIKEQIYNAIMNDLCDVVDFDDGMDG